MNIELKTSQYENQVKVNAQLFVSQLIEKGKYESYDSVQAILESSKNTGLYQEMLFQHAEEKTVNHRKFRNLVLSASNSVDEEYATAFEKAYYAYQKDLSKELRLLR
ncbi:MAG: hypothetical protein IMY67_12320 [Bacteroidetes bacterium]|nr:hypothetical protein [Bacteroidota bacterium]